MNVLLAVNMLCPYFHALMYGKKLVHIPCNKLKAEYWAPSPTRQAIRPVLRLIPIFSFKKFSSYYPFSERVRYQISRSIQHKVNSEYSQFNT
jgi:hypothetical protein